MPLSLVSLAGVLLAAIAVGIIAYFGFPALEKIFTLRFRRYIDWAVSTREKMFDPTSAQNVATLLIISTGLMTIGGYLFSRGYGWITAFFTLFFAFIGWSVPRWWIQVRWDQRIRKFDKQLVDGLNLMANSLRSGLNLPQALQVLVQEMPSPLSQEFGLVLSQQKIGLTLDEALEKMLERVPSDDLSVAIHSVLILRETGGNLSETFDVIANTIRERRKVDGKIKAMTQQGRMQGLLLLLMPFGLGGFLYVTNPEFLTPLITTQVGWMLVIGMVVLQVVGALWIKKIVTIDV